MSGRDSDLSPVMGWVMLFTTPVAVRVVKFVQEHDRVMTAVAWLEMWNR